MVDEIRSARLVAVDILKNVILNRGSLSTQLNAQQGSVKPEHLGQLKEVCFGVSRYFPRLNSFALHMLEKPFQEKDMDLYAVILIGLYQIEYMSTPSHAAVNEAVENTKALNKRWGGKLVNAILRRYLRESEEIKESLKAMPSVADSHPKWLLKRFSKHWPNQYQQIVDANNARPPMCLRVNLSRVSRETQKKELEAVGIKSYYGHFSKSALYLETPVKVQELPNFFEGHLSVQDEAAQLSAQILSPNPEERILDACAAPGGKTGHILESAKNIELTAIEIETWRLVKIQENLERLSLPAKLICADSSNLSSWWDGVFFDKILLDVPCSATGVIRRNPDIKVNRKPADIDALLEIQKKLLVEVWKTLKPGGQLLYATCSLMPEENEQQMINFFNTHDDAHEIPLESEWGENVAHGKQLFPSINSHDGFYYCLMKKRDN